MNMTTIHVRMVQPAGQMVEINAFMVKLDQTWHHGVFVSLYHDLSTVEFLNF